jgi:TRAP-type C4-dicarboxylate transport system substrate-binding protein
MLRTTCLAVCAAALMANSAQAQTTQVKPGTKVTIVSVTQGIPTMPQYTQVEIPLYKQATELTKGRIEFTARTRAEAGISGADMLRLIGQGQADIGAESLASISGDMPFLEMVDLAGLSPNAKQARAVVAAALPEINTQLARFGVKMIASYAFPASVVLCRPKVASFADLAGLKVRTFGPSQNELVSRLGAQPVSIGFPEVYGALQRGVADCGITSPLSANAAKWYEVTTHMYAIPLAWGSGGYFVNLNWWNKLDEDVRAFLIELYAEIENRQWRLVEEGFEDGVACNMGVADKCKVGALVPSDRAMSKAEPSDADLAKLQEILKSVVLAGWVKRCRAADCAAKFDALVAPVVGIKISDK